MWEFENESQKNNFQESIDAENCGKKLKLVREVSGLSRRDLAEALGCSESTIVRIETKKTLPTEDFTNRLRALTIIGHHKFKQLSEAEQATLKDVFTATGGGLGGMTAGVAGSIAAVSASGSVAGLSAAGITSGLAAIGGGTLLGGVGVIAAIPAAVGLAGYGLVKGIQSICNANSLDIKEVDGRYEITPSPEIKSLKQEEM